MGKNVLETGQLVSSDPRLSKCQQEAEAKGNSHLEAFLGVEGRKRVRELTSSELWSFTLRVG